MAWAEEHLAFQNKRVPGTYINFVSKNEQSTDIADRGYVALPIELDWGDLQKGCSVWMWRTSKEQVKRYLYDYYMKR